MLGWFLLAIAGFAVVQVYASSFFRERFQISLGFASLLVLGSAFCYMMGAQISGRIVNQVGRKPLAVVAAVVTSLFIILYTNILALGLALAFVLLGSLSYGMFTTTAYSPALEQVSNFRGSMMSLNSAAVMFGASLGTGVGGSVLLWLGYGFLGLTLGALSLVAAAIYYFLVIDERA